MLLAPSWSVISRLDKSSSNFRGQCPPLSFDCTGVGRSWDLLRYRRRCATAARYLALLKAAAETLISPRRLPQLGTNELSAACISRPRASTTPDNATCTLDALPMHANGHCLPHVCNQSKVRWGASLTPEIKCSSQRVPVIRQLLRHHLFGSDFSSSIGGRPRLVRHPFVVLFYLLWHRSSFSRPFFFFFFGRNTLRFHWLPGLIYQ
jgi:hypothetical protein